MNCRKCGFRIAYEKKARFCPMCGEPLQEDDDREPVPVPIPIPIRDYTMRGTPVDKPAPSQASITRAADTPAPSQASITRGANTPAPSEASVARGANTPAPSQASVTRPADLPAEPASGSSAQPNVTRPVDTPAPSSGSYAPAQTPPKVVPPAPASAAPVAAKAALAAGKLSFLSLPVLGGVAGVLLIVVVALTVMLSGKSIKKDPSAQTGQNGTEAAAQAAAEDVLYVPEKISRFEATIDGEGVQEITFAWGDGTVTIENSNSMNLRNNTLTFDFDASGALGSGSLSHYNFSEEYTGTFAFSHTGDVLSGASASFSGNFHDENYNPEYRQVEKTCTFDGEGRITGITSTILNTNGVTGVDVVYNSDGTYQYAEYVRFPDDPGFQYTYDAEGRLTHCEVGPKNDLSAQGGGIRTDESHSIDYTRNADGLPETINWTHWYDGSPYSRVCSFTYNENGLPEHIQIDDDSPKHTMDITYIPATEAQYRCYKELCACYIDYYGVGLCFFGMFPFNGYLDLFA